MARDYQKEYEQDLQNFKNTAVKSARAAKKPYVVQSEDVRPENHVVQEFSSSDKPDSPLGKNTYTGGSGAGAGRGKQGGPTTAEMNYRNSDSYVSPADQASMKADQDFDKYSKESPDQAYKKGGMASASKRADGIAKRGHTKYCGGGRTK